MNLTKIYTNIERYSSKSIEKIKQKYLKIYSNSSFFIFCNSTPMVSSRCITADFGSHSRMIVQLYLMSQHDVTVDGMT